MNRLQLEVTRKVNKYRGYCPYCNGPVPPYGGVLVVDGAFGRKGGIYSPAHQACINGDGSRQVSVIKTSGGTFTRNTRGRCEDAPCCGCCTI